MPLQFQRGDRVRLTRTMTFVRNLHDRSPQTHEAGTLGTVVATDLKGTTPGPHPYAIAVRFDGSIRSSGIGWGPEGTPAVTKLLD